MNQIVVEPYIDQAIEIEVQNTVTEGETVDRQDLTQYRLWQKVGAIIAGTILGTALGALFGIVFAYSRGSLPSSSNRKKGIILAGVMFFVLFLIPTLKYPANPPAVGDPETIYLRQGLYIGILAISGFSSLGLALIYRNLGQIQSKKVIVPSFYIVIIAIAFAVLPPNPDEVTVPSNLLMYFRIITLITMGIFWGILGISLGSFWDKLKPHETTKFTAMRQ
jgi:predicted cobalt transporter CbtA